MTEGEAPLKEYFDAESHGKNWRLICKKCGAAWSLPKASTHVGNKLYLLNHARSHDKKHGEGENHEE